jgi:hypothetical protein
MSDLRLPPQARSASPDSIDEEPIPTEQKEHLVINKTDCQPALSLEPTAFSMANHRASLQAACQYQL